MESGPAIFLGGGENYRADTCGPLQAASRAGKIRLAGAVHGSYPGTRVLPAAMLPEICSIGSWDAPTDQTWGLDWHRNEGIEFTYLLSGRLGFAVDRTTHRLRNGHLTITRPWQRHRVGLPHVEASRLCWLILDVGVRRPNQAWRWPGWLILTPKERQRLTDLLRHNERAVWKAPLLEPQFQKLAEIAGGKAGPFVRTRLALAVNELLLAILDRFAGRRIVLDAALASNERCVAMFLSGLPDIAGKEWTIDAMAEQCGLKRSRFTTFCRRLTNRTPAQYLIHCRLSEAARLLRSRRDLAVTEIAYACGFSSSQYFATAFRRFAHMSPSKWRAKGRW